jgi:hypothetical protein
VLDADTLVRVEMLNGTLTNVLRPAEIMLPRAAQFGLRVNF